MSESDVFQIMKSNDDVIDTILTNIVKMLNKRNIIYNENVEKSIKTLLSKRNDEMLYKLTVDSDDKHFQIAIIRHKITALGKGHGIIEFINTYKDENKIIIVSGIGSKALQSILNMNEKTEIFLEKDMLLDFGSHDLFVPYERLTPEQQAEVLLKYNTKKKNLPKRGYNNLDVRYYNLKLGEIVRIVRPSEKSGTVNFYVIITKGGSGDK